ncbi:MAG: SAM-dependent DNA methyltransferase [Candidatus Kuenenia sp.]|nr:SAM-dependent DNA methyltransferase [Candidatus Kuenenia hertensis]
MTQKQLEDYLWGAANILRGMIDAADFKQYIFPLLFFKRISDVWDEEFRSAMEESGGDMDYAKFREQHWFDIPDGCHWKDIRSKTIDVGKHLQKALRKIENFNFEQLHDIFGDAQWTNKKRLSDEKLLDLIEHFSKMDLSLKNVPHDIMGEGYEYLIKKFADDSGHTAAEFYTNRTVVKLMTMITDPQPGESAYDPTCGSGGILLNSALHLKEQKKEYRTLKLYGQELNLITSAIARMNMFMHNVDEFQIVQGDTLDNPQLLEHDELRKFDVIMANPPYSVKRWNQQKWLNDPYGRNIWGTPPQGCADYAFQQHIIKSLKPDTGRCVVLWPHGVLFRDAESELRKKMIEADLVDAVIGLGKNLFYNSSMESCLLVCRMKKPKERKGKIIFVNAVNEIKLERSSAYLEDSHILKIASAYKGFKDIDGFAKVVSIKEVLNNNGLLTVFMYVMHSNGSSENHNLKKLFEEIKSGTKNYQKSVKVLFDKLNSIGIETGND